MRGVLLCNDRANGDETARFLARTTVAGLPLLRRHLMAFQSAGIDQVDLVVARGQVADVESASRHLVPAAMQLRIVCERAAPVSGEVFFEQRADTVVDPRLLAQMTELASTQPRTYVCLDRDDDTPAVRSKSPYHRGVATSDEATVVDEVEVAGLHEIGLRVVDAGRPRPVGVDIGRYYWCRIDGADSARNAAWVILLATMKPTDGIWARTNRRLSLRISWLLLDTPVTPNMMTIVIFAFSVLAGYVLAAGRYPALVLGSFIAWFASMLDGVDGELARAKFATSALGHWLEMACDYAFYVSLLLGFGVGLTRVTGQGAWLAAGATAAPGIVISFLVVARMKREYARQGEVKDFYLAFQQTAATRGSNPVDRISPHFASLATRAALPYYTVLFTVIGLGKLVFAFICIGAHGCWIWALYASRLPIALAPVVVLSDQSRSSAQTFVGSD